MCAQSWELLKLSLKIGELTRNVNYQSHNIRKRDSSSVVSVLEGSTVLLVEYLTCFKMISEIV